MKVHYKWKFQLLICVAAFLALLAAGYLLQIGLLAVLGILLICVSAVTAEFGLRCPACKKSVFKPAMQRGAKEFRCPHCGQELSLE